MNSDTTNTTDVITDTVNIEDVTADVDNSMIAEEIVVEEILDSEIEDDDRSFMSKLGHTTATPFVAVGRFFGAVGSNVAKRARAANDIKLAKTQMKTMYRRQLLEAGRAIRAHQQQAE